MTSDPVIPVDVRANRQAQKWTRAELMRRAAWEILGAHAFAFSPRQAWIWRRLVLRVFGGSIGRRVHVYPSVRIAIPWNLEIGDEAAIGDRAILYSLGRIVIGSQATVSQNAHLCAGSHDYLDPTMPLTKSPVTIGDGAWICADAFVGPGVSIGRRAIVGARAVAMKHVPDYAIVVGNPAEVVRIRPRLRR
jgi:putative colanic acid biosynthesis acetyltransferase WcaF